MSEQPPPPSGQPPPSYQPPPPSNPNPLFPQGSQYRKNILSGVNPRIWVGAVIVVVVIAALLFWSSQQRGADTADRADRIALEQTSTQNAAIFITLTFSAITPTVDPKFAALETQNALLAQNLTDQAATSQALAVLPTQAPQVIIATQQPPAVQPTVVVIVQPTQAPQIVTVTPQPQAVQPVQATGCSRSGEEVNVGANSSGACATVSAGSVAGLVSQLSLTDLISHLDGMCEATVNACYQYRATIPNTIPASSYPSQRILWGDLAYVAQNGLESRIERLKCEGNICVFLITGTQPFEVGHNGRGLLLDQTYPTHQAVWTQGSFGSATGTVTLGNQSAWVTFQGWDGSNPASVVHGVIEPGFTLTIPAPFQGTSWMVTLVTYDAVTTRAIQARAEVVTRDKLTQDPPLVYVGGSAAPAGYTSTLPSQWNSRRT